MLMQMVSFREDFYSLAFSWLRSTTWSSFRQFLSAMKTMGMFCTTQQVFLPVRLTDQLTDQLTDRLKLHTMSKTAISIKRERDPSLPLVIGIVPGLCCCIVM